MKSLFTAITRFSLRYRAIILALVVLISALGVISITQLKQELLPSIALPQSVILTQVSGMSSEQVLNAVTKRLEAALDNVGQVVNMESTTTGAFGSVIIASNNYGENQDQVQADIQAALDSVWLPLRRITPAEGQNPQEFARTLLADVTPEMLIYLQEREPNFLFQLSPEVWGMFSDDTVKTVLAYLASSQTESEGDKGALRQLIDQEVVPQLEALDLVADVSVSGGQALPGDAAVNTSISDTESTSSQSLLFQLAPEVWQVVSVKAGNLGALNSAAVEALKDIPYPSTETTPTLPESWVRENFTDASDIAEMRSLTRTLGAVLNDFYTDGKIVGALGQTDDLTPEIINQMVSIDPTLVEDLDAEQLAAVSPEVFDALPADFIANLDGFTRDELAAKALAQTITGVDAAPPPVDLPTSWRISPPQLISFGFDDLPLATFSISSTEALTPAEETAAEETTQAETSAETETTVEQPVEDIPEGPALPPIFALLGTQFGATINTADDLIGLQLPEEAAAQFGQSSLDAATLLNFIVLLGDPESLPPGMPAPPIPINPAQIIGTLSPEAVAFLAEYDPNFLPTLQDGVFAAFKDEVMAQPQIAPPLASTWDTLGQQPQFADQPLNNAADLVALGDGQASTVLNSINETVPEDFAGYEVRLFDSLTPSTLRYLSIQEPDFYTNLDSAVLTKLSPEALAALPDAVVTELDEATQATVNAIASGEQESAAQALSALYASDVPAADPNAPALNADWTTIGNFIGVELDTADDFSRFMPDTSGFINSFFDSAQGAAFAPALLGNLSPEAFAYMSEKDPTLLTDLRPEALQLLPEAILTTLPADVQEIAQSGGTPFKPTSTVTRTNGNNSLLVTLYKTSTANTVEAFHKAEELLHDLESRNPSIHVDVSFEQASFIEESIVGVAKEGGLGGIFAVVIILVFLSTGLWARSGRRITGSIMIVAFLALLLGIVASNLNAAGGDFGVAFAQTDILVKVLLILGAIIGLLVAVWPGSMPYPAWRSTLVVSVSIPLSILMTLALMNWFSPTMHNLIEPLASSSPIMAFILRLFPASLTINIMTLSGLTVAIGRVVDDSIVVLENISRQIQEGGDKKQAIINGTRDVSVAIFSATVITVVVFLPLGLTGGIISEFFLPFGLAVTYALMSSFVVAITVVPVMAYLFIDNSEIAEEEHHGFFERIYVPILRWSLSNSLTKAVVLVVAFASLIFGGYLFTTRPVTFLPGLGEPQITVSVNMPPATKIVDTNAKVIELENWLQAEIPSTELGTVQTTVGGGGQSLESFVGGTSSVSENAANITVGIESADQLDVWAGRIREQAETIFGEGNVTVSAASLSDQGFGGFELVLAGPDEDLAAANQMVIQTLNSVPGITNATSDLQVAGAGSEDAPKTYIRIDQQSAVSFSAELETDNTIGVTQQAIQKVQELPDLPSTLTVSQGFSSELQSEGFQSLGLAMLIAMGLVIVILIFTFRSIIYWIAIILSIVVAPVGAAVLLTLTDRVLGISAMIGLLMLIGIVVTNAVVLIDRVQSNRYERGMSVKDALIEAGGRRLRPILMTAIATIFALLPLAIGLSKGAIIASELGTVVIGGLFSSTLLTLIIVPVMYSLLAPINDVIAGLFGRSPKNTTK